MQQDIKADLFSVEAEQQLLGAILCNNDAFYQVSGFLRTEHFYDPVHADIYRLCGSRIEKDHLASPVTMKGVMDGHEGLNELGGPRYLARLAASAISAAAAKDYAEMIVDFAGRRELSERLESIREGILEGLQADDAVSELELMLQAHEADNTQPRAMSAIKAQTLMLEEMMEVSEGRVAGVPTGLQTLDEVLSLAPKRYTILGGATSMGKTALAIWLTYAAAKAGAGVGFVTLEMPEEDLSKRLNSIEAEIPYKAYDRPMSETLLRKVTDAASEISVLPVQIFSEKVRDVPAILSEGKRLKAKWKPNGEFQGFKLLVVDYIQLVRGRGESQHVRLGQVANDLKQVAKALDVHILALAQIDRTIMHRGDSWEQKRPSLSDLRGSGDLEMAPDNVMFCFRPEYYITRETPPKDAEERADWEADAAQWRNKMEIIIGKARMGEITSVTVECDMATNTFKDIINQEEMAF